MKKKILMTGMNTSHCKYNAFLGTQLEIIPSHYSLKHALEDMGYEVHQRFVQIGEDLTEFDIVIVYVYNPAGFANYYYNALYALGLRDDAIIAFDDWQIHSVLKANKTAQGNLFRKYIKDQHKALPLDFMKYSNIFYKGLEKIFSNNSDILLSVFEGGDISLLLPGYDKDKLYGFNPNPFHLNRQVNKLLKQERERVFNFAGLIQGSTSKWLKKQEIEKTGWELKKYGSKKDGQDRVKEGVMVNLFANQWGILMAGYEHAGSGWWRARPLQVADAGAILIGEPKEMKLYYHDESLAQIKAQDLPDKSDKELQEIAQAQKEALYKHHPLDKEKEKEELSCLFKKY